IKLSAYFNWALKKGIIQFNPLAEIPKPKLPPRFPKALPEADLLEVLRAVTKLPAKYTFTAIRNKALICTFIFSGLRKTELLNLQLTDIDMSNGFIFVKQGKGLKDREVPIETTILKPILIEYIQHRERLG